VKLVEISGWEGGKKEEKKKECLKDQIIEHETNNKNNKSYIPAQDSLGKR
jgi:hypothetical protein